MWWTGWAAGVVLNDLYRLDPKAVAWTRLSYGGVAPLNRAAASVSILGGYVYFFGGFVTSGREARLRRRRRASEKAWAAAAHCVDHNAEIAEFFVVALDFKLVICFKPA
jgi:hypothetical protein